MVTVTECRDSMKSTLMKYMFSLFATLLAAVFYLGAELATIKHQARTNAENFNQFRDKNTNENKELIKGVNIIVDRAGTVFEKCCKPHLVYNNGHKTATP